MELICLAREDTYIVENEDEPHGGDPGMAAGRTNEGHRIRSLIGFEVDWQAIPELINIVKATLYCYYFAYERGTAYNDPAGRIIRVNTLLKRFYDTTATWYIARSGLPWTTPGAGSGDYSTSNPADAVVPDAPSWMTWDVTRQVKALVGQRYVQFRLADTAEDTGYLPVWYQHEGSALYAPKLVIEYTEEEPPTPPPGGAVTIPWQWIALGIGAIIALVIATRGKIK
ncbi:MAG: DNRLRE domain-containing protein [Dehalococcoidia bacterium]